MLLGGNPNDLGYLSDPGAVTGPESSAVAQDCKTGADANERDDCRIVGYVNSVQEYWDGAFSAAGQTYQPVDTVLFSGATSERLRDGELRDRAVLLPARQARLHRSRLLR